MTLLSPLLQLQYVVAMVLEQASLIYIISLVMDTHCSWCQRSPDYETALLYVSHITLSSILSLISSWQFVYIIWKQSCSQSVIRMSGQEDIFNDQCYLHYCIFHFPSKYRVQRTCVPMKLLSSALLSTRHNIFEDSISSNDGK